ARLAVRRRRGIDGDDRRHGDPAKSRLPEGRLRAGLRPRSVPHADLWPGNGSDHGLEAARSGHDPRAYRRPQRKEEDRSRSGCTGRGALMSVISQDITNGELANWDRDPVLSVEHLTMRFGGLVAIDDLSFNVGRGDITALIGPNGAGKTTVFNCVTGFYKPTEGRIVMRHGPGRQQEAVDAVTAGDGAWARSAEGAVFLLERMPDSEISRHAKVARTFQNIRLFGGMTLLENLLVAQHNKLMAASGFTVGGIFGIPRFRREEKEAIEKAVYWLERTKLIDRADDPAGDLPYGDQ